jgi:hypothetical protein
MFVVPQLLVRVLNREPKIDRNIIYLVFAGILPLFWTLLPQEIAHMREVNFLQHSIVGGAASAFVVIFIIQSLKEKYPLLKNSIFQITLLYASVCMLGVTNELLEFSLDYLHFGIFSMDRYDTWYDLIANTSGAFGVFLLYKLARGFRS